MAMAEPAVRRVLDHPKRRTIVIIVTCVAAVLVLLPAVDNYTASQRKIQDLRNSLQDAQDKIAQADARQVEADERERELNELEAQAFNETTVAEYRKWLVDTARELKCQVKRVDLGQAAPRKWNSQDDPLEVKKVDKPKWLLRTQVLSVTVTGPMEDVRKLMSVLRQGERLMHPQRLVLRPEKGSAPTDGSLRRTDVALELELVLFDVQTYRPEVKKPA